MEYKNLIEYIKIAYENIWTMHHYIESPNFFSDHEKLSEYYEKLADIRDELIETGLSLKTPVDEPSILEALQTFKGKFGLLASKPINAKDCFTYVKDYFEDIIFIIDQIKEKQLDFVKNKLEEIQYWLNTEANYKIPRLLKSL